MVGRDDRPKVLRGNRWSVIRGGTARTIFWLGYTATPPAITRTSTVNERAELILGGVRSGKSAYAEAQARASGLAVHVIATAAAGDTEMAARIAAHRARRPGHWVTHEAESALAATLAAVAAPDRCLLVDCLGLWVSNLLHAGEAAFTAERAALLEQLPTLPGRILLVSNEVGWGLVPMNALARRFADELGWLNQAVAARCGRVALLAAGLPLILKDAP